MPERTERNPARVRVRGDPGREEKRTQSIHAVGCRRIFDFSGFVRHLPHSRAQDGAVSGAGRDPAGVFHAVDVTHDSGGGDCAADCNYAAARVARAV